MNIPQSLFTLTRALMEEHRVPGVCLGLLVGDEIEILPFGITNIDNPQDVNEDTIFQIGSNTKTMTATILMLLAGAGRLDLDAPVRSVLPDFRVRDAEASASATIRQLLTHSTGWVGDHFIDTGCGDNATARYVALMADLPQLVAPGFAFSYNNSAFVVAGRVIEAACGLSFEAAAQEMLFEPLAMSSSFFDPADVMVRRFAVGHSILPNRPVKIAKPWPLPRALHAAGGVAATAGDLLTYARFYLDKGRVANGQQHLSIAAIDALWAPQFDVGGSGERVAHSWFVRDEGGVNSYSHGGATVGQMSAFKIVPDKRFAFVSLTNGSTGSLLNRKLEKYLLREFCQIEDTEPESFAPDPATVTDLIGRYVRPMADLEISTRDGQLVAQITSKQGFPTEKVPPRPPTPLFQLGMLASRELLALDGPAQGARLQIIRDEHGEIGWIRSGMRLHRKEIVKS